MAAENYLQALGSRKAKERMHMPWTKNSHKLCHLEHLPFFAGDLGLRGWESSEAMRREKI